MAWFVKTSTGGVAGGKTDREGATMSKEEAERSAREKNKKAEELGIKTRYEISEEN